MSILYALRHVAEVPLPFTCIFFSPFRVSIYSFRVAHPTTLEPHIIDGQIAGFEWLVNVARSDPSEYNRIYQGLPRSLILMPLVVFKCI